MSCGSALRAPLGAALATTLTVEGPARGNISGADLAFHRPNKSGLILVTLRPVCQAGSSATRTGLGWPPSSRTLEAVCSGCAPPISRLLKVGNLVSTDFCQFGTAWRKRTGLASWNACDLSPAVRLCCGRNFLCSRTHKPHMILKGRAPSGASWTKIAEPYPVQFARAAWTALDRAADHNALTRRFQIAGASHKTLKKGYGVGGGVQSHAGEALAIPLVHPKGGSPAQLPDTTG